MRSRGISGPVLVTGAYGLVGRPVVERLVADGYRVVATVHRSAKPPLADGAELRSVDLSSGAAINALVRAVAPAAIVHLAAVIPPRCYRDAARARAVNVDATATLIGAAEALATSPRFVYASSSAVFGSRSPYRFTELLTTETATGAADLYSGHKLEAETVVRNSRLDWVVLRLGGVMPLDALHDYGDLDSSYLGAAMPSDGRVHTVDARDVASAFSAAIVTDAVREVFLIGGDESHHVLQSDVARLASEAMGTAAAAFPGRPGDPDSDSDWFPGGWMDTSRAQQVLAFQHYTCAEMFAEMQARVGWRRRVLRLIAPVLGIFLRRSAPYRDQPGRYADQWGRIRARWGEPGVDAATS